MRLHSINVTYTDPKTGNWLHVQFEEGVEGEPLGALFNWLIEHGFYSDIHLTKHYGVTEAVLNRMKG